MIKKRKLFWAWQDEQEEAWLRQMAQQGLHLKSPGLGNYTFHQGEPRDVVYRLDYFSDSKKRGEYLQLFQDAGWEHVSQFGGWQYFRKPARPGEVEEIYTDPESKVQKYQRVLVMLVVFLPIMIVLLTTGTGAPSPLQPIYAFARVIGAGLMILYSIAILQLIRRIRQLKRRP